MTTWLNSGGCETTTHGWLPHDGDVGLGAQDGLIPRTGLIAGNKDDITNAIYSEQEQVLTHLNE